MIGKLLGPTLVQTIARYVHLVQDSVQTAATRTNRSIGPNLSAPPADRMDRSGSGDHTQKLG